MSFESERAVIEEVITSRIARLFEHKQGMLKKYPDLDGSNSRIIRTMEVKIDVLESLLEEIDDAFSGSPIFIDSRIIDEEE